MGELIEFPVYNPRTDVEVNSREVAEGDVAALKQAHISDVAAEIVEQVMHGIAVTGIGERVGTEPPDFRDVIMLKETVLSMLYRSFGMEHPLHGVAEENLVLLDVYDEEESSYYKYRFKSEPEEASRGDI